MNQATSTTAIRIQIIGSPARRGRNGGHDRHPGRATPVVEQDRRLLARRHQAATPPLYQVNVPHRLHALEHVLDLPSGPTYEAGTLHSASRSGRGTFFSTQRRTHRPCGGPTSASSGDGRSYLARNLTWLFTESGDTRKRRMPAGDDAAEVVAHRARLGSAAGGVRPWDRSRGVALAQQAVAAAPCAVSRLQAEIGRLVAHLGFTPGTCNAPRRPSLPWPRGPQAAPPR